MSNVYMQVVFSSVLKNDTKVVLILGYNPPPPPKKKKKKKKKKISR